jgi:hypothetical protein
MFEAACTGSGKGSLQELFTGPKLAPLACKTNAIIARTSNIAQHRPVADAAARVPLVQQ